MVTTIIVYALISVYLPIIITAVLFTLNIVNAFSNRESFSLIVFVINLVCLILCCSVFLDDNTPRLISPWIPIIIALIGIIISLFHMKKEYLLPILIILALLSIKAVPFLQNYNMRPAVIIPVITSNNIKKLNKYITKYGVDYQYNGATPLMYAAQFGNKEAIEFLLSEDAYINFRDSERGTPLLFAVKNKRRDIADFLINQGANVNLKEKVYDAMAPLHYAVKDKDMSMAKLLILNGADIDIRDHHLYTPLDYTAQSGDIEMADLLISSGADINSEDRNHKTPLHFAVNNRQKEMVSFLISKGADINKISFEYAIDNGNPEIAEYWVSKGREIKNAYEAAALGRIDLLQKYLDEYNDTKKILFDAYGDKASIFVAVANDRLDVVQFLIDKGANVNSRDFSSKAPLHIAVLNRNKKMAELLIDNGADVNIKKTQDHSETPLEYAIDIGDTDMVKFLISKGADINIKDYCGKTFLHIASEKNRLEIAEILISKGLDVNARESCFGKRPLSLAKTAEMKNLLLRNGAQKKRIYL